MRVRQILILILVALTPSVLPRRATSAIPSNGDEFVGPFRSWTNVRTYGAAGNGTADDTAALQRALDEVGKAGRSPVLFIPRGTYRITRTLLLAFNINVSVIGEDPATTVLVWGGEPGGTIMSINGIAYSRFTRLTFDGRRAASIAVDQSWDQSKPHFDTGNEYSDVRFVDVEFGLRGGARGGGFAETSVRRAHFLRNTSAGISLGNFNALDLWVWSSTFEDCGIGVTNTFGAGNFSVYNSLFRRSVVADMAINNTGGFSARGNYSEGSRAFFTGGGTNNPALIHIQRNTIVDPLDSIPIRFGNQGPGLLTDNIVASRRDSPGPAVSWASFTASDLISIGNTFTVKNPSQTNGRLITVNDRVVSRNTLDPVAPTMPPPLPTLTRQVFEVEPGSRASDIQNVIVAAARQNGKRPVVHLPFGTYAIDQTITIPATDIQIVGDGYGTVLQWSGAGNGPVLSFRGPSKATIRELQVDGAGKADGIVVETADQPGGRVYMDQAQLRSGRQTDLYVNRLAVANVQLEDAGFAYSPNAISIKVVGGQSGRGPGKTNIFSAASAGNTMTYEASDGARLLVRDTWYEGPAGTSFARVRNQAVFTMDRARVAYPPDQISPAFEITGPNTTVAIVLAQLEDRVVVTGNGSNTRVLGLGIVREQQRAGYFVNDASPPARATLFNSRHLSNLPGVRTAPTQDIGSYDPGFIRTMLAHTRGETPQPLTALPAGVTDFRLFRVGVANSLNNITLLPGTQAGVPRPSLIAPR